MTLYLLLNCDTESGSGIPEVYKTEEEAKEALREVYENLCPTDGDLEIEYDEENETLSWIDADMSMKIWYQVVEVYVED